MPIPLPIVRPRGRPPLAAADIALRKSRIIDVASRMFLADGFADTRLDAVGREAGVTKRTIYELIGDKNALFRAACDKLRVEGPNFEFSIPVAGRTVRDVLHHMARQLIDHALDRELIALERAVIVEAGRSSGVVGELVHDVVASGKTGLLDAIARVFGELGSAGLIGQLDTRRAAVLFYDVAVGALGFRAVLGQRDEGPSDDDLAERIDMFLIGYVER